MTTTTKTLGHSSEQLMEKIVDPDNLERASKKVRSNRGAPGPDGTMIDEFLEHFREHWPVIRLISLRLQWTCGLLMSALVEMRELAAVSFGRIKAMAGNTLN